LVVGVVDGNIVEFESVVGGEVCIFLEVIVDFFGLAIPKPGGHYQHQHNDLVGDDEHAEQFLVDGVVRFGCVLECGTGDFEYGCLGEHINPGDGQVADLLPLVVVLLVDLLLGGDAD